MKENENEEPSVTEAELARVAELDAKATRGPFTVSDDADDIIEVHREGFHIARFPDVESFPCLDPEFNDLAAIEAELKANADLFAEYRTLAPRLARELAAARAAMGKLKAILAQRDNSYFFDILKEWEEDFLDPQLNTHTHTHE